MKSNSARGRRNSRYVSIEKAGSLLFSSVSISETGEGPVLFSFVVFFHPVIADRPFSRILFLVDIDNPMSKYYCKNYV